MPLVIACPSCKAKLKAPENLVGKTVKCPSCQTAIAVRAPASAAAPAPKPARPKPPPEDDFDELDEERPAPRRGKAREEVVETPRRKGRPEPEDDFDEVDEVEERPRARGRGRDDDYEDDYEDDYDDRPKKKGKKARSGAGGGPTDEGERSAASMIFILNLLGNFLGGWGLIAALVWWLMKRGESKFVDHHGKEFINLAITGFLIGMLCLTLIGIGVGMGIGVSWYVGGAVIGLGALLLFAYGLFQFIVSIMAIFKAKAGDWYLFPMTWHLLKA